MDWEYLFADRIIERGYSYYCSCAVEDLTVTDDTMQANEQQIYDFLLDVLCSDNKLYSWFKA